MFEFLLGLLAGAFCVLVGFASVPTRPAVTLRDLQEARRTRERRELNRAALERRPAASNGRRVH